MLVLLGIMGEVLAVWMELFRHLGATSTPWLTHQSMGPMLDQRGTATWGARLGARIEHVTLWVVFRLCAAPPPCVFWV